MPVMIPVTIRATSPPDTARMVVSDRPPNFHSPGSVYRPQTMETAMGLMDVLGRYADNPNRPPPQVFEDFDMVAREAPEDDIGDGLEEAFRSDATPPFEEELRRAPWCGQVPFDGCGLPLNGRWRWR